MGIVTCRNVHRGRVCLVLAVLVALAGFRSGLAEDQEIKKLRQAAEQGDAEAQASLAFKYDYGFGVPKDDREALKWFRKAAEQGHADSQFWLARAFANGKHPVSQDYFSATYWYREAAEQGHVNGQVALAHKYERGLGVAQNKRKAAQWYRAAAEQGDLWAMFWLARLYARGQGVLEDYVEAYAWLNVVTAKSIAPNLQRDAGRLKGKLRKQMTAEQLAKGQRLAGELFKRMASSPSK